MKRFEVRVRVVPRAGILDPQGNATGDALRALGFAEVNAVHVGRLITLSLRAPSPEAAHERADAMCRQLLANPVIEDYLIEIRPAEASAV